MMVGCSNHNARESLGDLFINLTWVLRQLRGDKPPPTNATPCVSLPWWAKKKKECGFVEKLTPTEEVKRMKMHEG